MLNKPFTSKSIDINRDFLLMEWVLTTAGFSNCIALEEVVHIYIIKCFLSNAETPLFTVHAFSFDRATTCTLQ